jgi:hypothetical protein
VHTHKNIDVKYQAGFAAIAMVYIVLIAAVLGFIGYRIAKNTDVPKTASQQTIPKTEPSSKGFTGIVNINNGCRNGETVDPCFDQILSTDNGTKYGLSGQDLSAYKDQKVEIQGEIVGSTNPPTIKVSSVKLAAQSSNEPKSQVSPNKFDALAFYNVVENDMSYQRVKELANGKEGDCGQTAVYPPSGNMSCTWSDTKLRVTVNISQDKVISKQKAVL